MQAKHIICFGCNITEFAKEKFEYFIEDTHYCV